MPAAQNGTRNASDVLECAAGFEDGSAVLAGSTTGEWNGMADAGFAAVKLTSDGAEVWRWQVRLFHLTPAGGYRGANE